MAWNIPSNEKQRLQPRLLYPARHSFRMEGEIRSFPYKKKKFKIVHLHQTSIARDDRGTTLRRWIEREGCGEEYRHKGKKVMNKYLSIITLNVSGLNALIKRHGRPEWIRKQDPLLCCLQETHLRIKDLLRLKVKRWKKWQWIRTYK